MTIFVQTQPGFSVWSNWLQSNSIFIWTNLRISLFFFSLFFSVRKTKEYSVIVNSAAMNIGVQVDNGSNLIVHHQMNGWRRCDTYIQWNITQPQKKNEIMPCAATWLDLKIIILSEVSQPEKGKYHMMPLMCGI